MRVAVIGAGIVGVTSAYELARDGHEVTVFERRGSAAAENTFAHAGLLAPGFASPWGESGRPGGRMAIDPATLGWAWSRWRARKPARLQANLGRMQRLASYSQDCLRQLMKRLHLEHECADGQLMLLRSPKDLERMQPRLARLKDFGVPFKLLDAAQCLAIEPGLNSAMPLHRGIHLPQHAVGNCRQFALLLRTHAQELGVQFRQHTTVQSLTPGVRPEVTSLITSSEGPTRMTTFADSPNNDDPDTEVLPHEPQTEDFDAVMVCAALGAGKLLRPLGLKLPLLPVYGYAVTAPLRRHEGHPEFGPRAALTDARHGVTISRLGSRVRVSGGCEFGGSLEHHHRSALQALYKVADDWFPGAMRMSQAQIWKGARPMLPDGPPVLGASGLRGIWLNLGHGDHGWTLASGSARVVADLLANRRAGIDIDGLDIGRLNA